MNNQQLKKLLNQGEGTQIEFKTAHFELPKTIFESICGFLNRYGGHLILGVDDNEVVTGVLDTSIKQMIDEIVSTANNPKKTQSSVLFISSIIGNRQQKSNLCFCASKFTST